MRKRTLARRSADRREGRDGMEGGGGEGIRGRLLCYRCHERELFVLSFEEKSEPLLKHILEWLSTGSPVLSSTDGEDHRNIVPEELVAACFSLSLSSLSFKRERERERALMFCRSPSRFSKKKE